MAHFLPPEHVRQVNKLEWPNQITQGIPRNSKIKLEKGQDFFLEFQDTFGKVWG